MNDTTEPSETPTTCGRRWSSTATHVGQSHLRSAGDPGRKVPERLGRYRVIELIGRGAMGEVYRAEHALLGRPVALKVLRPALVHSEELAERFFAEARAVNVIGHENIVEISDFVHEPDGTTWLVMELLEGKDLAGLLQDGPLPLRRALAIVRQICDALVAIHDAGIVHRDIKPENVFVTDRDGEDFVKLLDFGIAQVPDSEGAPGDSGHGHVFGTPPYMAPEQACGDRTDHRCDLYAVGALLFELLTGRMLFHRDSVRELLAAVAFAEPPVLSESASLPASVSREVDELVARCLAKDAADRPQSAREIIGVLDRIERCLADVETDATVPAVAIEAATEWDEVPGTAPALVAHAAASRAPRPLRLAVFASCVLATWAVEPSSWLERAAAPAGPSRASAAALASPGMAGPVEPIYRHDSSAVAAGGALGSASVAAASAAAAGACRAGDECAREVGGRVGRTHERKATRAVRLRRSKTLETAMVAPPDTEGSAWSSHPTGSQHTLDPDLLLNPFASR